MRRKCNWGFSTNFSDLHERTHIPKSPLSTVTLTFQMHFEIFLKKLLSLNTKWKLKNHRKHFCFCFFSTHLILILQTHNAHSSILVFKFAERIIIYFYNITHCVYNFYLARSYSPLKEKSSFLLCLSRKDEMWFFLLVSRYKVSAVVMIVRSFTYCCLVVVVVASISSLNWIQSNTIYHSFPIPVKKW